MTRELGLIVIGSEVLSGKRQDKHFARTLEILHARGLALAWCRIVGDDAARITATLRETYVSSDIVFCCGGLGNTPDDLTRACAAEAAGVRLARHPDAVAEIEARFGTEAYPSRILMADLPAGSRIIPNPCNRVPGFSLHDHHFVPGFPVMAWPMMEWVLDTQYAALHDRDPPRERRLELIGVGEGELLALMQELVRHHPAVTLSSLPEYAERDRRRLELGLRGRAAELEPAWTELLEGLRRRGLAWREL